MSNDFQIPLYYDREGDDTERSERTIVPHEFPGDAFTEEFGPEFVDYGVWVASCLRDDVADRQDLFDADLWDDDWVRAWLRGEGDADGLPGAVAKSAALQLADLLEAVETAERFLDEYTQFVEEHDLKALLTDLRDAYPGLDATARQRLWSLMLGSTAEVEDIHDSKLERARFLRDELGLQVVQTAQRARPYEGDPSGKDLDGDVALLQEIHEQFAGVYGAGDREGEPVTIGGGATITTKCVRQVLEGDDRLSDIVSAWDNYGNITGDNDLGDHRLAAVLGTQHYGDHAIEKMAALGGEEVTRSGHGQTLDYDSEIANTYLQHMREDQTMQAVLRFTRGESGAVVFAHTSSLRDDLPVVGQGQVVKSWCETAATLARAWKRYPGEEFTVSDLADAVDVGHRQVRRILNEFADAGYLSKHETGPGLANKFSPEETPTAGIAELPGEDLNPDTTRKDSTYTKNVRVWDLGDRPRPLTAPRTSILPAPEEPIESAPAD